MEILFGRQPYTHTYVRKQLVAIQEEGGKQIMKALVLEFTYVIWTFHINTRSTQINHFILCVTSLDFTGSFCKIYNFEKYIALGLFYIGGNLASASVAV